MVGEDGAAVEGGAVVAAKVPVQADPAVPSSASRVSLVVRKSMIGFDVAMTLSLKKNSRSVTVCVEKMVDWESDDQEIG